MPPSLIGSGVVRSNPANVGVAVVRMSCAVLIIKVFALVELIVMPLLLPSVTPASLAVTEPDVPVTLAITLFAFANAALAWRNAGSICGATLFAEMKAALACKNAAFAYDPELTAFVFAVLAAMNAAFAYEPDEATAACKKLFAAVIVLFSVFAAAEDARVDELVDVNEPLIKLDVNILE